MPSLDDYAGIEPEVVGAAAAAPDLSEVQQRPTFQVPEFLKAKTGAGSVEEYINHPMNIGRSPHMARVIRGLTGMVGALDYAIVDVVIGGLGFVKKKPPIDVPGGLPGAGI